jgi:hypothetical protein
MFADRHVNVLCSPRSPVLISTSDVMFEMHDYLSSRLIGYYRHVHK